MAKPVQSLSGKWKFKYDKKNIGITKQYQSSGYNKNKWQTVKVPSFWGETEYDGTAWYAIDFVLNEKLAVSKKLGLCFESVDDNAVIFLNDEKVHYHEGANINFFADITKNIRKTGINSLVIQIIDNGGPGGLCGAVTIKPFENPDELRVSAFHEFEAIKSPDWVKDAIIYELYVRAHSEEGSFEKVTEDLVRLKKLGVNCIWFMPIFPVGQIMKKGPLGCPYAIADFKEVNSEYGSKNDFNKLVAKAHSLNMKIILDIACNHSAWDNVMVKNSPEYYTKNSEGKIIHPLGTDWTDVADFNYDNMAMRDYMWDVLEYWVKDFNVDGYRCDVAELVPDDFWTEALDRLIKIKPDVLMLAEGAHPRLHLNGFHLTYAWDLRSTIYDVLNNKKSVSDISKLLKNKSFKYPKNFCQMNFTENHDKDRTVTYFGNRKDKVAAVITMLLPGIPMIYGGQEIGETKTPSLFHKNTIIWENDSNEYQEFYKKLFFVRNNNSVLKTGKYLELKNDNSAIYSFVRHDENTSIVVIANTKNDKHRVTVNLPDHDKDYEVLMGTNNLSLKNGKITAELLPYEYTVVRLKFMEL